MTITLVGQEPQIRSYAGAFPYALEADGLARARDEDPAAGPIEMRLDDSLGNARTLDQWRAEIGLVYPFEADDANIPTVSGEPLTVATSAARIGDPADEVRHPPRTGQDRCPGW